MSRSSLRFSGKLVSCRQLDENLANTFFGATCIKNDELSVCASNAI